MLVPTATVVCTNVNLLPLLFLGQIVQKLYGALLKTLEGLRLSL